MSAMAQHSDDRVLFRILKEQALQYSAVPL